MQPITTMATKLVRAPARTLLRASCSSSSLSSMISVRPAARMQQQQRAAFSTAMKTHAEDASQRARTPFVPKPVFSSWKVYKTKSALDVTCIRSRLAWNSPVYEERKYLYMERYGGLRFLFAEGEEKQFDWKNGESIVLSLSEMGEILAYSKKSDEVQGKEGIRIFHDPNLGTEFKGQTRKEFIIRRSVIGGKTSYYFNLAVSHSAGDQAGKQAKFSVALSEGEFQVLLTLINQAIPELLGIPLHPQIERPKFPSESESSSSSAEEGGKTGKDVWNDS